MKKLALVIPVYNEEKTIESVLINWGKILDSKEFDIILINDGSTDKTQDIILNLSKKVNNLHLINKKNEGHGSSIIKGYEYAIKENYKYIFQTDSDDQFSTNDFNKFWNLRNELNNIDIIVGSRIKRNDPIIRIFLSKVILRILIKLFFKKKLIDPNIPYRLMSRKFLFKFLQLNPKNYIAPNIIMSLYANSVLSLEVSHYKRIHGEIRWSIIKLFKFGLRLLKDLKSFRKLKLSINEKN